MENSIIQQQYHHLNPISIVFIFLPSLRNTLSVEWFVDSVMSVARDERI